MRKKVVTKLMHVLVPGFLLLVMYGQVNASAIFLTGGTLNGQSLSSSDWTINVEPNESITGNILMQVNATGTSANVVFPLGYTWTWGNRETSMVSLSSDAPFGYSNWNVSINLDAPSSPGNYYMLFGLRGEYTLSQVFSCTNWTAGSGVWHDGNDYHDMTYEDLVYAHENGSVDNWQVQFPSGYQPSGVGSVAVMPVGINVVPLPGAVWLFASGILGLIAFRRKTVRSYQI